MKHFKHYLIAFGLLATLILAAVVYDIVTSSEFKNNGTWRMKRGVMW